MNHIALIINLVVIGCFAALCVRYRWLKRVHLRACKELLDQEEKAQILEKKLKLTVAQDGCTLNKQCDNCQFYERNYVFNKDDTRILFIEPVCNYGKCQHFIRKAD